MNIGRRGKAIVFVLLCLVSVLTVYPLLFMALNSIRTNSAYQLNSLGLPSSLDLQNYRILLSGIPLFSSMLHSIVVVIPAVILATIVSALAAFVFTKTPFRGTDVLFYMMLLVMLMPGVVLIIPLYVEVVHLGFANSFGPAILIYTAVNVPFGTYLLRSNFRGIPDALVEAARVDGASWLRVFTSIILRLGMPAIITVAIMTFFSAWNDLFMSIVLLHTPETEMLTPTLTQLTGRYVTDVPVLLSGLLIATLPTLILYLLTARFFTRGLLMGSFR